MSANDPTITIPDSLLPSDGRFGVGPSLVRTEAVSALAEAAPHYLGTSHRQSTVRDMVGLLRRGLAELFALPEGYEVILGNGGTTAFWDAALFGLIRNRSQHLSFGEFSSKFAAGAKAAPFLEDPSIISAEVGSHPEAVTEEGIDLYAFTQNETSTGVMMPLVRPAGTDALVAVDATSGAGGLRFDPSQVDVYYFAPQKALASDGGLWLAACSPAAIARIEELAKERWIPSFLDLAAALDNSRKEQTYNTPALATIFLAEAQVSWINSNGGLEWAASRCDESARIIYDWADNSSFAEPFVQNVEMRSHTVATIDLDDSIEATTVSKVLRQNGIVDTESYRKLGRNQLRIALFPAIEPANIKALCASIDYVAEKL